MKHKFFVISALNSESDEQSLNQFCSQHRVVNVEKAFVAHGERSYWSVCVTWLMYLRQLEGVG